MCSFLFSLVLPPPYVESLNRHPDSNVSISNLLKQHVFDQDMDLLSFASWTFPLDAAEDLLPVIFKDPPFERFKSFGRDHVLVLYFRCLYSQLHSFFHDCPPSSLYVLRRRVQFLKLLRTNNLEFYSDMDPPALADTNYWFDEDYDELEDFIDDDDDEQSSDYAYRRSFL